MKIKKILMARELRKSQTPCEKILWQALRNRQLLNFKFHRQFILAGFILDFYCPALKLGIEVDGSIHNLEENKIYDLVREKIFNEYGVSIIRFTNENIKKNLPVVIQQIKNNIISSPLCPEGVERG